jgi:predicted nucleotidyltransferase
MTLQEIAERRKEIEQIGEKYGIRSIHLFGSVARGSADENSDVDFLVSTDQGVSLLGLGGFQVEVEQLLGIKVDVVTAEALRPRIRQRAIQEAVAL